ncbi:MAG: hypothetical protein WCD76_03280 [Pyrinomonadaceae bacterium]
MIRKIFLFTVALLMTAVFAFAQDAKPATVKVSGYLIDNMCAGEHADGEEAKEHKTSCALMPGCSKGGFTVVAEGNKAYKLDEHGSELAKEVANSTKTKKGLKVAVEGTMEGETLHVSKLSEVQ